MTVMREKAGSLVNHVVHVMRGVLAPSTVGVRVLALSDSDEIILVRHHLYPGWHLPGGGIDRGETAVEAALRELMEESGAETSADALRLFGVYANPKLFVNDHVIVYATREFRTTRSSRLDSEIAERGIFPVHALPQGTSAATLRRLHEFQGLLKPTGRW
ncbi:MAG: NUDIX domain-containing protein [Bdellovibrionota bacterium]|nr:MAG: NUDIX domain-containing protein [Bdellovibrionota bacterium]